MLARSIFVAAHLAVATPAAYAQMPSTQVRTAVDTAPNALFSFLIGRWTVTGTPHVSALAARFHGVPQLSGTWQATQEADGYTVHDDVRATDAAGRLYVNKHFARTYDAKERRWSVADGVNTTVGLTTVRRHGDEMSVTIESRSPKGDRVLIRHRFSSIRPASFVYAQDRSEDHGETWTEPDFILTASRIARSAVR